VRREQKLPDKRHIFRGWLLVQDLSFLKYVLKSGKYLVAHLAFRGASNDGNLAQNFRQEASFTSIRHEICRLL
jgi:hypothetical protein